MKGVRSVRKLYCCVVLFFSLPLHALYNGNPSDPMLPENGFLIPEDAWFGVKTGYEWDRVFDKSLRVAKGGVKKNLDDFDFTANSGILTLGFGDRVEAYGGLGVSNASFSDHQISNTKISYHTQTQLSWSTGGRAILAFWSETFLGIFAGYLQFYPHLDSIKVNKESFQTEGAKMHYREWQVGVGVSHKIKFFVPYAGVQYTDVRAKVAHLNSLVSFFPKKYFLIKNQKEVGLYFGCSIAPEKLFSLNLEARVINETAVTASADIRF